MATPAIGLWPETVELRTGVDWDAYVRIDDEIGVGGTRLTYYQGNLEIMTLSGEHDRLNRLISDLFSNLAEGFEIDFRNFGGATHRHKGKKAGFEPDTAIYVTNLDHPFDGSGPIMLPRDPPPDLIVEVDISRSSLKKMAVYAAAGCREGWRHHRGRLTIHSITGESDGEVDESSILPGVRTEDLNFLLDRASGMPRIKWAPFVREWARTKRSSR